MQIRILKSVRIINIAQDNKSKPVWQISSIHLPPYSKKPNAAMNDTTVKSKENEQA